MHWTKCGVIRVNILERYLAHHDNTIFLFSLPFSGLFPSKFEVDLLVDLDFDLFVGPALRVTKDVFCQQTNSVTLDNTEKYVSLTNIEDGSIASVTEGLLSEELIQ